MPLDFLQNKVPKIDADDLQPVSWEADPSLEWAPPGHGDLYTALVTSGMLDTLLEHGYRYAFVSNSDNLGAVLDPRILAWVAREELPFAMEVAGRTEADRKGGHIARLEGATASCCARRRRRPRRTSPRCRTSAATATSTPTTSGSASRPCATRCEARDGVLGLPIIVNRKTVDPSDPDSTPVVQLETAMGAAIGVFEGARALHVPRRRFAPVKTTNDLLALRSDAYVLLDDRRVELAPSREEPPVIDLEPDYYKLVRRLRAPLPGRAAVARGVRAPDRHRRRDLRARCRGPRHGHRAGAGADRRWRRTDVGELTE